MKVRIHKAFEVKYKSLLKDEYAKLEMCMMTRPKDSIRVNTLKISKDELLWRLEKIILDTLDFKDVVQKIVDSVLMELGYLELGYRIVVLALLDDKGKYLKRISRIFAQIGIMFTAQMASG